MGYPGSMASVLLNLRNIHVTFGGRPVLESADLMVSEGERVALVGRNGSGKSTLLKVAAGLHEADGGEVWVQPGTTVRYLPQEPDLSGFATVYDYVAAGLAPGDDAHRARRLLEDLGLTGAEAPATMSGGEARRAALARTLAPEPDVLLLDEPTNHLDLPAIEWLEAELKTTRSALILISHDRHFLEALTNRTVWLDRGHARRLNAGFGDFESWRDQLLNEEEIAQAALEQQIATEEHWMRHGVTARRKRNVRRVNLLAELRQKRKDHVQRLGAVTLEASAGELSGRLVIEADKMSKHFDTTVIADRLSLTMLRGDRLAMVGPNGAGKTTLINLLTKVLEPDEGSVRHGTNLQIVTLDQSRQSLDPSALVADVITDGRGQSVTINGETKHVVTYMRDFLFGPEQARTPVSVLSGGERARLILARELAKPSNFLILDEPTNDLDLETLDLLQELLAAYPGTILLVSHDRDFLDRVATSVLMAEGQGKWLEYAGGYSDMMAQRGAGIAARKVTRAPAPARRERAAAEAPAPAVKRKLSYKEKFALENLPGEIAALNAEIADIEARMADGGFFTRDPDGFAKASLRHAEARAKLETAEDQWLELELLKGELEA